jgi:steroid delta-isomerase-like uncharacterized protein
MVNHVGKRVEGFNSQFFEAVLNRRELSRLPTFVAVDYIEHGPTPGQAAGLQGVAEHIQLFFSAFSDIHYNLEAVIVEENKVVARWTLTGRHSGGFLGIKATGKQIEATGIDIYYFQNDKIREHWHEMDMLRLVTQLKP